MVLKKGGEISWTDRVTNDEVLYRFKDKINILNTIKRRKVNCVSNIGHITLMNERYKEE